MKLDVLRLVLVIAAAGLWSRFDASAAGAETLGPPDPPPEDRKRDDRDLSERLIRKATTGTDDDIMDQVVETMSNAEQRLTRDLDPGAETQSTQGRILRMLDQAIKVALRQRSTSQRRSTAQSDERRKMPEQPDRAQDGETGKGQGDAARPGDSANTAAPDDVAARRRGPLREFRRGWGHLPQRDREELLQGIEEEFVDKYRRQIEQYYRALGDTEETP